jgi:hypothetical protein
VHVTVHRQQPHRGEAFADPHADMGSVPDRGQGVDRSIERIPLDGVEFTLEQEGHALEFL